MKIRTIFLTAAIAALGFSTAVSLHRTSAEAELRDSESHMVLTPWVSRPK